MSLDFESLLSRADAEVLQGLLGSSALRLMTLLDPKLASPSAVREVLLAIRPAQSLVLDRNSRRSLLELLSSAEASTLVGLLGLPRSNPFAELDNLVVRKNSLQEQTLLDFFHLHSPAQEVDTFGVLEPTVPAYPLFPHQRRAVKEVRDILKTPGSRVLLHMPTGAGKTRTAMNAICDQLRAVEPTLVVWLAYSEELCDQAVEEFGRAWSALGDRTIQVVRFYGEHDVPTKADLPSDGLLVCGLTKLYRKLTSDLSFMQALAARTSLVVLDEAHQAIADTYALVLDAFVQGNLGCSLLGLTATPGRTWNDVTADQTLADYFSRTKVGLSVPGYANPVRYLMDEGYIARVRFEPLLYNAGYEVTAADVAALAADLDIPRGILKKLEIDEQRNLKILTTVESAIRRHRRVLVFASSVWHSDLLAAVLHARGVPAQSVTSATPRGRRSDIIDAFKARNENTLVLCNYGVLTTGFDAPMTSAAIIARPTRSLVLYSQMVGRAIRGPKAGGNSEAEILTVVDSALPGFGDVAEAFENWEDVWRN